MKKFGRLMVLGLTILVGLVLVGCGGPGPLLAERPMAQQAKGFPLTVTDGAGRMVTVAKAPQRIVPLAPSNTEILFALGLGERVIGVDEYSDFPAEAKTKEKVGSFAKINMEKVVSLGPDLIFAANIHLKTVVPELEKRGFVVIVLQPKKLDGVLDDIRLVGKVTGVSNEAEKLATALERRIQEVRNKTKGASRSRVFFELDAKLFTAGPGSFVDEMISTAGGDNIAADAKTLWPQLTSEGVVLRDPQVIILADHGFGGVTVESVKARPGWASVAAVRDNRIVPLDPDLVNRPGPRVVDGLVLIAKAMHPELFP